MVPTHSRTSPQSGDEPKAYLEISKEGQPGVQRKPLLGAHIIIGRNPQAEIVLEHTTVSRAHAELVLDPFGRWWVHDLGSTNGTYVNGTLVEERMINLGDTIGVGDFSLRVLMPGARAPMQSIYPITDSGPPITEDEDATLIAVMPKVMESPQISASHLTTVMALGRKLMAVEDPITRMRTLGEFLVGADFPADAALTVRVRDGKPTKIVSGPYLRNPTAPDLGRQVSVSVLKSVYDTREPVLASNARVTRGDIRRLSMPGNLRQLAVVACPLGVQNGKMDVLYVEFPPKYGTAEWLTLVTFVAEAYQQADLVWEMRGHVQQSAYIERELQMARQIQEGLVPRSTQFQGLQVAVGFEPCRWVGGDYVDVVQMPDGRALVAVADVCGKGLQAALVASSLHTMVHATVDAGGSLRQLIQSSNSYLCSFLPQHSFVTMVLIAVHPQTGALEIVNAGHPPPLAVAPNGRVRYLQSERNVALGMLDTEMELALDVLGHGESLVLYTDGLTELVDQNQQFLGVEGFAASFSSIVQGAPFMSVDDHRERVSAMLNRYRGSQLASDDSTFLIARRT